ncbi:MAG TPA: hypothetical protein DCL08_07130 [Anaerolineaceae bacterium]|nr:MAG: hypothetical protein XE06_0520 [Anaerolineaceae bacterium 46_22]HAF48995.1 hypothetical protein [Anaerolineaceae bacterium]
MSEIEIGRLLRSGTTGFVVGCKVNQLNAPSFGAMVRVPLEAQYQVYGVIYDIHIEDDGLVRQLITAQDVPEEVLKDNRENRNVPVEIGVLALGYEQGGRIFHLLPPRPPLSLDAIFLCSSGEVAHFTGEGRFGYFRHILRDRDKPIEELLAAHLYQARAAQVDAGNEAWYQMAVGELITLMRDDYQGLIKTLSAVSEI